MTVKGHEPGIEFKRRGWKEPVFLEYNTFRLIHVRVLVSVQASTSRSKDALAQGAPNAVVSRIGQHGHAPNFRPPTNEMGWLALWRWWLSSLHGCVSTLAARRARACCSLLMIGWKRKHRKTARRAVAAPPSPPAPHLLVHLAVREPHRVLLHHTVAGAAHEKEGDRRDAGHACVCV